MSYLSKSKKTSPRFESAAKSRMAGRAVAAVVDCVPVPVPAPAPPPAVPPPAPGCVAPAVAPPPVPPPGCICEPPPLGPVPLPAPVVPAAPVGAGAAAAVVAGRLAQPVRTTADTSNDIAMIVEHRVSMTPPLDLA